MERILGLLAIGGLLISLLVLLFALLYDYPSRTAKNDGEKSLLLIVRDYEGQVEGLVRWLQFRCWWLEVLVDLVIAIEPSHDDTVPLLTRLQRRGYPFRLLTANSEEQSFVRGERIAVKLVKDAPIPWGDLEQALRECKQRVA